jgi:hypothetical protein
MTLCHIHTPLVSLPRLIILIPHNDLDLPPTRHSVERVFTLTKRKTLGDELFEIHDSPGQEIDSRWEARRGVSRDALAVSWLPHDHDNEEGQKGFRADRHSPLTSNSLLVTARVGKMLVWLWLKPTARSVLSAKV